MKTDDLSIRGGCGQCEVEEQQMGTKSNLVAVIAGRNSILNVEEGNQIIIPQINITALITPLFEIVTSKLLEKLKRIIGL